MAAYVVTGHMLQELWNRDKGMIQWLGISLRFVMELWSWAIHMLEDIKCGCLGSLGQPSPFPKKAPEISVKRQGLPGWLNSSKISPNMCFYASQNQENTRQFQLSPLNSSEVMIFFAIVCYCCLFIFLTWVLLNLPKGIISEFWKEKNYLCSRKYQAFLSVAYNPARPTIWRPMSVPYEFLEACKSQRMVGSTGPPHQLCLDPQFWII